MAISCFLLGSIILWAAQDFYERKWTPDERLASGIVDAVSALLIVAGRSSDAPFWSDIQLIVGALLLIGSFAHERYLDRKHKR